MTITLAAVYAPIGFLGGLTGALFREFAFTLAGSVIVSGVDRADAVADDVLGASSRDAEEGRFAKLVNRVFGAMTRWYGRQLDRSLDYRPITGAVRADHPGAGRLPLSCTRRRNWRRRKIRASCSRVTKAPKYANIDYIDFYGDKLDKVVRHVSRDRSALRPQRHQRPARRHRRHAAEAVGRAQALVDRS